MSKPDPSQHAKLRSELARNAETNVAFGAHTVTFQPPSSYPTEDRHLVEDWQLANGTWKFIGVFDGHGAGHEAVDFVVETLPGMIKACLASAVGATDTVQNSTIEDVMIQCISSIDDRIMADLVNFFPGGPRQISELTDEEIVDVIKDPETGNSCVQIMRARTGTTALVALVGPLRSLHVASLGDCDAVLGMQNILGEWEVKTLSECHNAGNESEADRVRAEHPDEAECISRNRTLGLITLTRAIGDAPFKLPQIYTGRVLALATPPFHENYGLDLILARNLTPPYLSNRAEVKHVDLVELTPARIVLVLCSDGLIDLYSRTSKVRDIARAIQPWITTATYGESDNLALDLLCDAFGGDDEVYDKIIQRPGRRVDDTTIVVLPL